ncbi:MAG: MFS transporter [Jatrophihabitans sp.]|uniref:MFS transporter n=1 Tax=Jatrophihabitans sp. TaxID=1932789 RepID=UPI003F80536F
MEPDDTIRTRGKAAMTATLTQPVAAAPEQMTEQRTRSAWIGFAVVLAALILNILDSTIVQVAAPSIQRDLAMSSSALEWIAAGYTLAIAVGLMTGGRLGDRFGRRPMLLLGLTAFVLASSACAFAWSPAALVTARAVQGLAAAVMIPQCFGLIRDLFPAERMQRAFAALGPVIGLSTILGPVVAGLLLKADVAGSGWRALFLINLPVGVVALVVGHHVLPKPSAARTAVTLDLVGTVLLGTVSMLIVFPLVDGRSLGWPLWLLALPVAAVPLLATFVGHQRRRLGAGRTPLIEPSLLGKRSYVSGVGFTVVFFGSVVGFGLVVGLFLQLGLGFSPLKASLYLAGLAVGAFVGSGVGAWAMTAVGRPILHVGLTIMAGGTTLLYLLLHGADGRVTFWDLAPGLTVFGVGMGMIFVPLFSIVIGDIDDHEVGSATGVLESLQQLGASLGVAVLATVFFDGVRLDHGRPEALPAAEHALLLMLVLIAAAWAVGWLLPRRARAMH